MWYRLYCPGCDRLWWYETMDRLQLRMDLRSIVICPAGNHLLEHGQGELMEVKSERETRPDSG